MSLTRFRLKETTIWVVGLAILAGGVVLSYRMGSAEFADEFAVLTLQKKALVGGGAIVGVAAVGEAWTRLTVGFSAVLALGVGVVWFIDEIQEGDTRGAQSGREVYRSGIGDSIRAGLTHGGEGALAVDRVYNRSRNASVHPTIDREVSVMLLGQTNMGKSTEVTNLLEQWDLDEPVIAHAISEPGGYNELGEALDELGADTVTISSTNSDVRWDPFLDRGESIREMMNITEGVFRAHRTTETGWSDAARAMLTGALTVTNAKHGDFAALPDVIEQGPDTIIEELGNVPNTGAISTTLDTLDAGGRSSGVRGILVAQDVHQLDKRYGDMAGSIWSNCPNRIAFRAGDTRTAKFVLSSLGEVELHQQNVSTSWSGDEYERSVSDSYETGLPLTTGDLTSLEQGEALVQSPDGWWLCKLSK